MNIFHMLFFITILIGVLLKETVESKTNVYNLGFIFGTLSTALFAIAIKY